MGNPYLFFAYAVAWLLFGFYVWNLSRRQEQLRKDLDEVKRRVEVQTSSGGGKPK